MRNVFWLAQVVAMIIGIAMMIVAALSVTSWTAAVAPIGKQAAATRECSTGTTAVARGATQTGESDEG